jgi:uncharacterized RDD family membrane protein YckC
MQNSSLVSQSGITIGAGFWIRALARLVDVIFGIFIGLFSGLVVGIFLGILQVAGMIEPGWDTRIQGLKALSLLLSMIGGLLYQSAAEGIYGAAMGKLICGLRVITAEALPCDMKKAFLRNLAYFFDALFFGLVGYMSMKKSALNQRYGDVWAKTVVVKSSDVPEAVRQSMWMFFLGLGLGSASWAVLLILDLLMKAAGIY